MDFDDLPPCPVNVRLRHEDGTEIPLELAFLGWDAGMAVWTPAHHIVAVETDAVLADMIPANTALVFAYEFEHGEGECTCPEVDIEDTEPDVY